MVKKPQLYPKIVCSSLEMADTGQGKPILDYLTRFYREAWFVLRFCRVYWSPYSCWSPRPCCSS